MVNGQSYIKIYRKSKAISVPSINEGYQKLDINLDLMRAHDIEIKYN